MELLNLLSNIRAIRIERKTLEDLISDLIEREKPSNYPNTTIQGERVQSNHTQKPAENVYLEMQNLINELAIQKDNLLAVEVEATRRVYKEITDPLERAFIIKRFIQNKPVKEIIRDFGWSRPTFYKKFEKYFPRETNLTKIDKFNSSRCNIM
jgi:hypothetical protein